MAGLDFDFSFPTGSREDRRRPEVLRILVLADLSGNAPRDPSAWHEGRTASLDVDRFDAVLAACHPRLEPDPRSPAGRPALTFESLEDFHPDGLFERLESFRALRDLRQRVDNPATFARAAAELAALLGPVVPPEPTPPKAPPGPPGGASLLEGLLGGQPAGGRPAKEQTTTEQWIQEAIRPHLLPAADPRQEDTRRSLDAALGAAMRAVLHDPAFQRLEATWRSLAGLVATVETGPELRIDVLDVRRHELLADVVNARSDLTSSRLHRKLRELPAGADGEAISVLVVDLAFSAAPEDIVLLAALASIAARAGATLLAAADGRLLGCTHLQTYPDPATWSPTAEDQARWQALRRLPVAATTGLLFPRVLLRQPYGRRSDEIDAFPFEELVPRNHESYLWGNPAFAVAGLLAQAFVAGGWDAVPAAPMDLTDLPAHSYEEQGEKHMQACAEAFLSDAAAEAVLRQGVMPLVSFRQRNQARVLRLQSIAEPSAALAGPWSARS